MTIDEHREQAGLGWAAIGWTAFMILASGWTAYRIGATIEDLVSHSDPRWRSQLYWALPTLLGLAVLNIVGLALILGRRKLGVYVFGSATVAALIVNVIIGVPILTLALAGGGLLVLLALLRPRWSALR